MRTKLGFQDLNDEVAQIRKTYPRLRDDGSFVLWFLRAVLADSEEASRKAITGDKSDKSIDAVLIDEKAKQVHLVQGKFHHSLGEHAEKRNDVLALADLGSLPWMEKRLLEAFYSKLDPLVKQRVQEMIHNVRSNHYALRLYYVTTGRCSETVRNEAEEHARQADGPVEISIFDFKQVMTILKDYLEGVAPAVPTMMLRIASEGSTRSSGVIYRFDPAARIESWVFSMTAKDVGEMYRIAGIRLFARNVRGYLGESNEINEAMTKTVRNDPRNFWYYNNGITIVCDEAKQEKHEGEEWVRAERPQVINGQQTTRTLSDVPSTKATVMVRVIKIPRNPGDDDEYDDLVSEIVRATNWQNAIKPSDLVSNDYVQVHLERELRKRGYQYLRKRQTKSEARRQFGGYAHAQIKKEELAQAIAACEFDPALVRKGKEGLFDARYYRSIFVSRSLSYYLSRYWLMHRVQTAAWGKPQRAYAKWVVLNFSWARIGSYIGSGQREQRFRYACEQGEEDVLHPLNKALDATFRAALAFFRSRRGEGEEARDISTFFQLTRLHSDFTRFWRSGANPHRANAERRFREFRIAVDRLEVPG